MSTGLHTTAASVCNLADLLHEPLSSMHRRWRRHHVYLQQTDTDRNRHLCARRARRILSSQRCPQRDDYFALVREDNRSRIYTAYHFGDFVYGLNFLLQSCPQERPDSASGRRLLVLTEKGSSAAYQANLRRLFGAPWAAHIEELNIARLGRRAAMLRLVRALHRGNCSLVMFCDLPPAFGAEVRVSFLGRPALFPAGPATLSIVTGAPMLPVICTMRDGRREILLSPQIEPVPRPGESRAVLTSRLTQSLVCILEQQFRPRPEYWRFLRWLPAFLQSPQARGEV